MTNQQPNQILPQSSIRDDNIDIHHGSPVDNIRRYVLMQFATLARDTDEDNLACYIETLMSPDHTRVIDDVFLIDVPGALAYMDKQANPDFASSAHELENNIDDVLPTDVPGEIASVDRQQQAKKDFASSAKNLKKMRQKK
jgi:hypothetical protein